MDRFATALRLVVLLSILASCSSTPPQTLPVSTPSVLPATQTPLIETRTELPPAQAEHRIGVRQVNGVGEFYDKQTNEKFVPRGANYVFIPVGNRQTNLLLQV